MSRLIDYGDYVMIFIVALFTGLFIDMVIIDKKDKKENKAITDTITNNNRQPT